MAIEEARMATLSRRLPLAYAGYLALLAIVGLWAWRAFHDSSAYDTYPAYGAGVAAWTTGRPEALGFWTGLPSLAGMMALVSRVLSLQTTGYLVTIINLGLFLAAASLLLQRIRGLLAGVWWWIVAFGLVTFVPLMSTVWWKQFNLISLVLAALGFELVRRRRSALLGGGVIGVSLAIKPMVILLPFVMLVRSETRRAGAAALAWLVGLNLAAQALMAARGGSLDPLAGLRNLLDKTHPNLFLCHPVNFSPGSLLCRSIGGTPYWTVQRIAVYCLLALFCAWVVSALRGRTVLSWDAFAFMAALSAMLSPFEWTHYQVMLLPLFILLVIRFVRDGAGVGSWLGLALAFTLTTLIWQPYGTLLGTLRQLTGGKQTYNALSGAPEVTFQEGLAQFAQYILIVTGALWYSARLAVLPRDR